MQAAKTTEAQSVSGAQGTAVVQTATGAVEGRGQKVRAMLRAQLGEEIYSSWFKSLEFEDFDGRVVKVSVPVKFVRNWIQEHYAERLLHCSRVEFATAERVEVVWRQPGVAVQRPADTRSEIASTERAPAAASQAEAPPRVSALRPPVLPAQRTSAGGLEGSEAS